MRSAFSLLGQQTRLGEALLELIGVESGETLSGIVVLSDGESNAGVDTEVARSAAIAAGARIITVGFGSSEKPLNLQLQKIQAPTYAHVGDNFEITAFLTGQGLAGRTGEVVLSVQDERTSSIPTVLQTKQVTILEDEVPVSVGFVIPASEPGRKIYTLRVSGDKDLREFTLDDNEKPIPPIEITDRKTKVLLLAGGPMRDFQFVRNLYFRDRGLETHLLLQSADSTISQEADKILNEFPSKREDLFEYDVIMAFDPDWNRIPSDSRSLISEWLFEQAGGMVLVAGDVNTPSLISSGNDLETVRGWYPVVLPRFYDPESTWNASLNLWPIKLTREGESSEFLDLNEGESVGTRVWESFPGVSRCFPDDGPKRAGTILAYHSDPRGTNGRKMQTFIAGQFYGSGRVLYLSSGEFWRLRAMDESYYDRFWIKLLRESGQGRLMRGSSRGLILPERRSYSPGSSVVVRARLLDARYQPITEDRMRAEVLDPQGRISPSGLMLNKLEGRPGEYQGTFPAILPGRYRIRFEIPQSTESITEYVQVEIPNYEYLHPEQNLQTLRRLATTENGGTYLESGDVAEKLSGYLSDRSSMSLQFKTPHPLWDRAWVMSLLIALLGAEWIVRKFLKLA